MIKDTCKECGDPCELLETGRHQESGFPGSFTLVDEVSACCSADFEEMTDGEQEAYEEEYWGEQEGKAHKLRRIEQRRREQNDNENEPVEKED